MFKTYVFLPSVGETPNTWASQAQLPWQRQTSPISITSLQAQPLAQTVCASSVLKSTRASKLKLSIAPLSCDANLSQVGSDFNWFYFCPPGGADRRRGEGTSALKSLKLNNFEIVDSSCLFRHILSFVVSPSPRRDRHRSKSPRRHRSRSRDRRHRSKSPGKAPSRSEAAEGSLLLLYQQVAADSCNLYHLTGFETTPKDEREVW